MFPSGLVRAPRSPHPHPTPLRSGRPSGGFRARGGSAAACEGAPDLPSLLPPFINGKPEMPALPGWGGWWQPPGIAGGGGRQFAFPCRGPGLLALSRPGRSPTLGLQLASWALGRFTAAVGRSRGSGAREFGLRPGDYLPEAPSPRASLVRSPASSWTPRARTWVRSAIAPSGSLNRPVRGRP